CAVDAAVWDLQAKTIGRRVWDLAGIEPRALETQFTLGISATPEETAANALAAGRHRLLKIKLGEQQPLETVQAVREARPDARLVVDANQAWSLPQLQELAPALAELGVHMIEQPLKRGEDAGLERYRSPVPLCADESCQHLDELPTAAGRYQ